MYRVQVLSPAHILCTSRIRDRHRRPPRDQHGRVAARTSIEREREGASDFSVCEREVTHVDDVGVYDALARREPVPEVLLVHVHHQLACVRACACMGYIYCVSLGGTQM